MSGSIQPAKVLDSHRVCDDAGLLETRLKGYLVGRAEVVAAYLFGSQAKGTATADSDVDVAVLLQPDFDLHEHFMYRIERMVELEQLCQQPVDLVILNQAALVLRNQVLKHGRLVYERDHRQRVLFEVRSRQAYYDFQPMLAQLHAAMVRQIREVGLGSGYRCHRDPLGDARRACQRLESTANSNL